MPDPRRQRQCHALRQRPQPGLGDGVRHEMRRQRPDPLVQHVDHHAFRRLRQDSRELLRQYERRPQVRLEMRIPARAGPVVPFVAFERAGVVDQNAKRPERRLRRRDQPGHVGFDGEVGGEHAGPHAARADVAGGAVGVRAAGVAVDRDAEPGIGQGQRNRAAEAPRASRHQGRTRNAARYHRREITRGHPSASASVSAITSVARYRSASGTRSSARWAFASSMLRGPAPYSTIGTPAAA